MNTPRLLAAAALVLAGSAVPLTHADAADRTDRRLRAYHSIGSDTGTTTLRACRERSHLGAAWRVYLELDNTDGDGAARARLTARNGRGVLARWSSGRVPVGEVSDRTSVRVPDRGDVQVSSSITAGSGGGGGGGPFGFPRC